MTRTFSISPYQNVVPQSDNGKWAPASNQCMMFWHVNYWLQGADLLWVKIQVGAQAASKLQAISKTAHWTMRIAVLFWSLVLGFSMSWSWVFSFFIATTLTSARLLSLQPTMVRDLSQPSYSVSCHLPWWRSLVFGPWFLVLQVTLFLTDSKVDWCLVQHRGNTTALCEKAFYNLLQLSWIGSVAWCHHFLLQRRRN